MAEHGFRGRSVAAGALHRRFGWMLAVVALAVAGPAAAHAQEAVGPQFEGCLDSSLTGDFKPIVRTGETVVYRLRNQVTPECAWDMRVIGATSFQTPGVELYYRRIDALTLDAEVTVASDAFEVERLELCLVNQAYVDDEPGGWLPVNGGDLCRPVRLAVTDGRDLPDLWLDRIAYRLVGFGASTRVVWDVTVRADRPQLLANEPVEIAWGTSDPPSQVELMCERELVGGGGCFRDYAHHLPPGTHTVYFCVDPADRFRERFEGAANCSAQVVTIPGEIGPDLGFDSFGPVASPPRTGEETRLRMEIRNRHGVDSEPFDVVIRTPEDSERRVPQQGLEGYGERTVEVPWTPLHAGQAVLEAVIDADDDVDRTNNDAAVVVQVVPGSPPPPPPPAPDLYLSPADLTMMPPDPRTGDSVTFTATVRNVGTQATGSSFRFELYAGGSSAARTCGELAVGELCSLSLPPVVLDSNGNAYAVADTQHEVSESIETNNDRILYYVVDGGTGVTCQGTWSLRGDGHSFNTSSQGAVVDDCRVSWGQNTPSGCWATIGVDGITALWHRDGGSECPTRATVTTPDGEVFRFTVEVLP